MAVSPFRRDQCGGRGKALRRLTRNCVTARRATAGSVLNTITVSRSRRPTRVVPTLVAGARCRVFFTRRVVSDHSRAGPTEAVHPYPVIGQFPHWPMPTGADVRRPLASQPAAHPEPTRANVHSQTSRAAVTSAAPLSQQRGAPPVKCLAACIRSWSGWPASSPPLLPEPSAMS